MQYHTILFNTIQLHAIPFNIQEHMILYNAIEEEGDGLGNEEGAGSCQVIKYQSLSW